MKNFSYLVLCAVLISCSGSASNESKEDDLQNLKNEVMAIHDEVMPKIGSLRKTRMRLDSLADSLISVDSTKAVQYKELVTEINAASQGMMDWMHDYEPEFTGTEVEIRKYLEEQKKLITKVKEDMNGSLAKGEEALKRMK